MALRPLLVLLAVAATWGASYLLIAIGLRTTSPSALTFARFVPAAILIGLLAWHRGELRALRGRWRAVALLAVVQQAAPMLLIAVGEESIPSGLAGTLVAAVPLWGALLAPALGGIRPTPAVWTGLLVGIAGVAALLGATTDGAGLVGSALVLLAALGYAIGAAWTGRRFPDVPRLGLLAGVLASSCLLLVPAVVVDPPRQVPSAESALAILVLSLLGTALAFVAIYWLIGEVGPERAVLVTYLAPVFAVAYGTTLLDERFTTTTFVGMVLVLAGAWLAGRRPRRRPLTPDEATPAVPVLPAQPSAPSPEHTAQAARSEAPAPRTTSP